jgi:signal peptidase II
MRDPQDIDVLDDPSSGLGGLIWALPVALAVVLADQLTKRWALGRLTAGSCDTPDACIDLIAGIRLHLVFNTGAAFARGQGFGPVLGVLVSLIAVVLLVASWRRTDRLGAILLGAIAGGAVGNLIDRMARAEDGFLSGAVVDFVDVGWWPVFNVADASVVCGVLGFVALSWLADGKDPAVDGDGAGDDPRHSSDADPGAAADHDEGSSEIEPTMTIDQRQDPTDGSGAEASLVGGDGESE